MRQWRTSLWSLAVYRDKVSTTRQKLRGDNGPNISNTRVHLVDASGNINLMPQNEALDAVKSGQFQIATPEQIHDLQMEQQYGDGLGNTASAFRCWDIAWTISWFLSDQLLAATGISTPEALKRAGAAAWSRFTCWWGHWYSRKLINPRRWRCSGRGNTS